MDYVIENELSNIKSGIVTEFLRQCNEVRYQKSHKLSEAKNS
jgi:hypothetical protein